MLCRRKSSESNRVSASYHSQTWSLWAILLLLLMITMHLVMWGGLHTEAHCYFDNNVYILTCMSYSHTDSKRNSWASGCNLCLKLFQSSFLFEILCRQLKLHEGLYDMSHMRHIRKQMMLVCHLWVNVRECEAQSELSLLVSPAQLLLFWINRWASCSWKSCKLTPLFRTWIHTAFLFTGMKAFRQ